jgi:ribulose-5-phosphate 4-epimerase/fuculose-1-phosphate aldolase
MSAAEQNQIGPRTIYNDGWLVADGLIIGTAGNVSVYEGRDCHHALGFTCHELEEADMCGVSLAQPTAIVGSQTVADDLGRTGS